MFLKTGLCARSLHGDCFELSLEALLLLCLCSEEDVSDGEERGRWRGGNETRLQPLGETQSMTANSCLPKAVVKFRERKILQLSQ